MRSLTDADLLTLAARHLTANQCRALELRMLGHTYTEIGLELDISRQAARARVRSATEKLSRIIAHRKAA